jgi:exonuclease VII large subunit
MHDSATRLLRQCVDRLHAQRELLAAYNPQAALERGYALVRTNDGVVRRGKQLTAGQDISISLFDADVTAAVKQVTMRENHGD